MNVRFLVGPAGSGKTHRCLSEIRTALKKDPGGAPLLLLAPKQSTFQLERQLLSDTGIAGWSRLQVLSFERLAGMILEETGSVELLDEEGRVMVLRALLRWHQPKLRLFRAAARMAGFARELSDTLRELHRHRLGPERIEIVASEVAEGNPVLSEKLRDLALMAREYQRWLSEHRLLDVDLLPELAADRLRSDGNSWAFEGVWLDGFAEMTPQEVELLAAVVGVSRAVTLSFCAEQEFTEEPSWLSTWAVVGQTVCRCAARIRSIPGAELRWETLSRGPGPGRFAESPALAALEAAWSRPQAVEGLGTESVEAAIRLVACADFEREAEIAAREILRHVQAGGRYRETAVILRSLDEGAPVLRRVFLRYGIPFFLDRRESISHHPVAELSRCALRMAAMTPRHEDWFGALKSGLLDVAMDRVDAWENEALASGWSGEAWLGDAPDVPEVRALSRAKVEAVTRPFQELRRALAGEPDAYQVADSLRRFWEAAGVRARLESWADAADGEGGALEFQARLHASAWEQIDAWLKSLERGFGSTGMPMVEWLGIVEAGLATLTAGVIPPAQDQVLIGAVDRSRQPELKLALVLGVNEGMFPAKIREGGILGERDRDALLARGIGVGPDRRRRVGQERYLGYVACSRASRRLVITWSARDESGRPMNPSAFVTLVRSVFPSVRIEADADECVSRDSSWEQLMGRVAHRSEILPWLFARPDWEAADALAGHELWRTRLRQARHGDLGDRLEPDVVTALFGVSPEVSVGALESFASCPFQFFVRRGLRGRERETFEVDARRTGSLAHELLARFHQSLALERKRWRDIGSAEARKRVTELAGPTLREFGHGIFSGTIEARWEADAVVDRVRDLVGVLVDWMAAYRFDPELAEVEFGGRDGFPPWTVEVGPGRELRVRGKVDRVDVCRESEGGARFVVIDYKWRARKLDERMLRAGVDLQIAAYAVALGGVIDWEAMTGGGGATIAGFCYVGLGGKPERAASRSAMTEREEVLRELHRHRGRLSLEVAGWLDSGLPAEPSGQFLLKFKKDGSPSKVGDGRSSEEIETLLRDVGDVIRRIGDGLFSGDATVAPIRLGAMTACERCDLRPVCRFDPWTRSYRVVKV